MHPDVARLGVRAVRHPGGGGTIAGNGSWTRREEALTVARLRMVEEQIVARGVKDARVCDAMRTVPRHLFVDPAYQDQAYDDAPLPIGERQTISQPYMVALMTEALEVSPDDALLEVGTGSGYQAAILSLLAKSVISIERFAALADRARRTLEALKITTVTIHVGDGSLGWPAEAPYQGIIVTAGAPAVPQPLRDQLAPGGRLVVPVGSRMSQSLLRVRRTPRGDQREDLGGCRFVPLTGAHGWGDDEW